MPDTYTAVDPTTADRSLADRVGRSRSIAFRLAWRNITRDRVRLGIAAVGVGFAVLLMTVQLGLLIGFALTSSSLIDNAKADFWVVPRGAKDVDQAGQMPERHKYLALGAPGVSAVESMVVRFADWKRPDGGTESVIVVGIDPYSSMLQPWNLIAGSVADLRFPDGVIIDELYAQKLGVTRVGEIVEIMGHRARIAGITSKVRTFTQSPYVFASLKNSKILSNLPESRTTYLMVRAAPGADLDRVRESLKSTLPTSDVLTSNGFSWQTRIYWLFTTGAGAALLIAAALGLIVGLVIVSQTLYSATVERVHEYATIRAMGASNKYLRSIILRQSLVSGSIGYAIGTATALFITSMAQNGSAAVMVSVPLLVSLAVVTLAMCIGASLISIRKVLSVDAASVFR